MTESTETTSLMSRYTDAYLAAQVTVGIGSFIKTVGIILAVLIFLASFGLGSYAAGGSGNRDGNGGALLFVLFVGGINAFIIGFIFTSSVLLFRRKGKF